MLTKYVLLAKDPCLKADNKYGSTNVTVSPLRVTEPLSKRSKTKNQASKLETVEKFKTKQEFTDEQIMDKAHHMFLHSNAEDSYYIRHFDRREGAAKIDLPQKLWISDKKEEDTVHRLRQRIRLNKFDNLQFDPRINHEVDKMYKDVYVPNREPDFRVLTESVGDFIVQNKNLQNTQDGFQVVGRDKSKRKDQGIKNDLKQMIRRKVLKEIP